MANIININICGVETYTAVSKDFIVLISALQNLLQAKQEQYAKAQAEIIGEFALFS